jgi:hypothetical protein
MLYACFTLIALCFAYTSWNFYAFSGTNLLIRCHSVSSCFLLFLYFRKVVQKIFSELDETKPEVPILLSHTWSPKKRRRRAPRQPHQVVARPWQRHRMVWAPRAPSYLALPPINCHPRENPKSIGIHPRKGPQRRRHQRPVSRDRSLYSGTLPGRGISPGAISIDSTAIFIIIADSHDEEGILLPRGWGLYR